MSSQWVQLAAEGGDVVFNSVSASSFSGSVTGSVTGDLAGTASWASSSLIAYQAPYYTTTASFNAFSASYVNDSASFDSRIDEVTSATGGFVTTQSFQAFTQSMHSFTTSINTQVGIISASYATTASNLFRGNQTISGSITVTDTITAQRLIVQTVSSSVIYSSGSNIFGDDLSDTQQLVGTVTVSGTMAVNNSSVITSNQTSSMSVLFAQSASEAPRYTTTASFNAFTASYNTGSFIGGFTGSFSGSLNNLQGTATHIPFFSSSQVLGDSIMFQTSNSDGSNSITINQDGVTTAAPEALYVWQPSLTSFNVISGKGNLDNYLQLNIQNANSGINASSDVVATANNGNETINYIDMGINSSNFSGSVGTFNDAYVYATGRNLHLGNASNFPVQIFAGGFDTDANVKLTLSPNNQHTMTGSLNMSGDLIVLGSVTSSLYGTASWAQNAVTAFAAPYYVLTSSFNTFSSSYVVASGSFDSRITLLSGSYSSDSASFDTRISTNSSSFSDFSGSYVTDSASFDNRIETNSASFSGFSSSYVIDSASFTNDIVTNSASFSTFSGSYVTDSSSVDNRITTNSSSFSTFSGSYSVDSSSFDNRIETNSSSFSTFSGSYATDSSSFDNRIETNSASFSGFSGSYVTDSASVDTRIVTNSASFSGFSGSYVVDSSSFDNRINNISGGLVTVSGSLVNVSSSYTSFTKTYNTGSFSGSFTGSFGGNGSGLNNIPASGIVGLELNRIASGSVTASVSPAYGFTVNASASVSGTFAVSSSTNAAAFKGSGSGLFTIDGTSGRLLTIDDSLTGTLLSVIDSSNLPILEVNSDHSTVVSGSLVVTQGITGSLQGTASWANNAISSSYGLSSSYAATSSYANNFIVGGTLTAQTLIVQTITSSVDFVTGSTRFGTIIENTHQFTGSVSISGSLAINGADYATTSASFDTRILNNSSSVSLLSGSYLTDSASFDTRILSNSSSIVVLSSSVLNDSSSFDSRILTNSSSISTLSGSYVVDSASFDSRILTNSSSIGSLSGSYVIDSASFDSRVLTNSSSIGALSSSYVIDSSSFDNRILVNSSSIGALSSSYVSDSASFDTRSTNNSSSISSLSSSFVGFSSSYVTDSGSFRAGLDNVISATASFATTGSNIFRGDQTITGSILANGSNTFIGSSSFYGQTFISGGLIISASQNQTPATLQIYGDVRQKGGHVFLPVDLNIDPSISGSYIFSSGSTNDLYFGQSTNGNLNITRLRWLEGNLYTGLLSGGLITAATGSTVFNVSSGSGMIVTLNASLSDDPYPTIKYVKWDNITNIPITNITSSIQSFIGIDGTGSVVQQTNAFNNGQYNTVITIGTVLHQNKATVNASITYPNVAYGYKQRTYDFVKAFGPLKLSGLTINTSGSLGLTVGSGTAFADGRNYQVDPNNPSYIIDPGTPVSKIFRYYQSGSEFIQDTNNGAGYNNIDPVNYNNSGSLTPVPGTGANRQFSIQRVFWYPNSATKGIVVYYGNRTYPTLTDAVANIPYEAFEEVENTKQNAVYLGAVVVRNNAAFTDTTSYSVSPGGIFRQVGGSGGGGTAPTARLVDLSDVSITAPSDYQPLVYNTSLLKWVNGTGISASLHGNADTATSASYAYSASQAISSSYALSSSYSVSSSYALSSSYAASASVANSSSYSLSSSYAATASYWSGSIDSASYAFNATSASYASVATTSTTASYADNFIVDGTLTARTIIVQTITSSVDFITGSTRFGSTIDNTHQFTGSVSISGSLAVNDSAVITTSQTSSMVVLSSSYANDATSASYALSASYAPGSDTSVSASYALSASYSLSSSYALSASHADTASYWSGSIETASYASSASVAISSSYADSASYWSGSIESASYANSASYALSASYWSGSIESSSYALTASYWSGSIETASYAFSASVAISSSYAATASYALNVPVTAAYADNANSASYALTASYWSGSIESASHADIADTASFAFQALSASVAEIAISSSYALTASYAMNAGGTGVSAIYIADQNVLQGTASYFNFTGSGVTATINDGTASISITGGGSGTAVQGASVQYTQPTLAATWSINHAINSRTPVVEVYDSNYSVIIPTAIQNPGPYQTIIYFDVPQSGFAIISTGGVLSVTGSNAILNQTVASSTWSFSHDLNSQYPVFTIFDNNNDVIIPQRIHAVDTGSAVIYFSTPRTGTAVASVAGAQDFVTSASYAATASYWSGSIENALSSSYAATASYWSGSINNALSSSFATTASRAINANAAVSASYALSASHLIGFVPTFPYTGAAQILGSLGITGSSSIRDGALTILAPTTFVDLEYADDYFDIGTGLTMVGNAIITGSLTATSLSGSLLGTASNAVSSSFATTSSYAVSSSYSVTSSYALSASVATSASYALNATSASYAVSASTAISSSFARSASYAATSSFANAFTVAGTLTAQTLVVQTVTSSVVYSSGSNIFGNSVSNTHQFTGSVTVTGSLSVLGSAVVTSNQTASMSVLTASYAISSSQAASASIATTSSYAVIATTAATASHANTFSLGGSLMDYGSIFSSLVGTNNFFTRSTGSYTAAFYNYFVQNGTNARSGQVMAVWNTGSVAFTDVSTTDIGNTSAVTASVAIVSGEVQFNLITNTSGWGGKSTVTYM